MKTKFGHNHVHNDMHVEVEGYTDVDCSFLVSAVCSSLLSSFIVSSIVKIKHVTFPKKKKKTDVEWAE